MKRETQIWLLRAALGVTAFAASIYVVGKVYPFLAERLVR